METRNFRIGELEFDCQVSGDSQNELIILLHGFPETAYMWLDLIEKLAAIGFYCIAPNMRGYSKNACPKGVKHYQIENLTRDILNIVDKANKDKFHLIGHDWGAAIGWNLVYNNKSRIISWTGLSVPHNKAFRKAIMIDKEQRKKSRYIKWFLIPFLPEMMLRKNDFKRFRRLWKHSSKKELENYLNVFRRKQTLTAALNYYRANIGRGKNQHIGDIETPTLFIWGNRDLAIGAFAVKSSAKYMKGDYTFKEVNGGHWLIQTNYSEVEAAIVEHVSKYKIV